MDDPGSAAETLKDLLKISNWASQWLVKLNPRKTESLIFSCRLNQDSHPTLYMNDVEVQEGMSHKHLGLYFSNNLKMEHPHRSYSGKSLSSYKGNA